ncbi:hypothetical protein SEA_WILLIAMBOONE_137 [Gordonia phage WilliamBoone]|nr:hypothetical protein SEA_WILLIAMBOONE_137 [Gordonia phage WilliamBoone]
MSDVLIERISDAELEEMFGNEKTCDAFWYSPMNPKLRIPCTNAAEYIVTRACCGRRRVNCSYCVRHRHDCLHCGAMETISITLGTV